MKLTVNSESVVRTFGIQFAPKIFGEQFQLLAVTITIDQYRNLVPTKDDEPFFRSATCNLSGVGLTVKGQPDKREAVSHRIGTTDWQLAFGQAFVNVAGGEMKQILGNSFRDRAIDFRVGTIEHFVNHENAEKARQAIAEVPGIVDEQIRLAENFLRCVQCIL